MVVLLRRVDRHASSRAVDAFLLVRVALELAGVRELAELVADHLLGHEDVGEAPAVVHGEGEADELGHDGAGAAPGLDGGALGAALLLRLGATEQLLVDDRALLE
jgi:hypothetical protein